MELTRALELAMAGDEQALRLVDEHPEGRSELLILARWGRLAAVCALGSLKARQELLALVDLSDEHVSPAALFELAELPHSERQAKELADLVSRSPSPRVQSAGIRTLGVMGHPMPLLEALWLCDEERIPEVVAELRGLQVEDWTGPLLRACPFAREAARRNLPELHPVLDQVDRVLFPGGAESPYGVLLATPSFVPDQPGYHELQPQAAEAALERLSQARGPAHLLVVGPSGVGKTAFLARTFARLTERGFSVVETSTGLIVAGAKYIGEWQRNLKQLVERCLRPRRVVLYFTDLQNLPHAGVSEGNTESFAGFLKPYLDRGEIVLAGELTPAQLAEFRLHPEISHLFLELPLPEPRAEEMPALIESLRQRLAPFAMEPQVLDYLIELSDLYGVSRAFPGKTVDLLEKTLNRVERERSAHPLEPTADDVIETLAASTGLPTWLLNDSTPLDLTAVRRFFRDRIVGQTEAVDTVVDLLSLIKAGLNDPGKPLAVLFFVGPTGVGKTELAKSLAEFLFGSPDRMARFDMSEYKDYDASLRLIGSPYGNTEGLLTRRLREQPFSVLLLDEFEKAHPNVYDLMLQVFDDGRLTSSRGDLVSFRQSIVIMTSNLGAGVRKAQPSLGFLARPEPPKGPREVLHALEDYFRPEFLNRIRIVNFLPLDLESMQQIAQRELRAVLKRSGLVRRGLTVEVADSFSSLLLRQGFSPEYGARPLKRALEKHLLLPLARRLVKGKMEPGLITVDVREDEVRLKVAPRELPAGRVREERQPAVLAEELARLRTLLDQTAGVVDGSQKERARLVRAAAEESFWNHPEEAIRMTSRLRFLELQAERQAALERSWEEAERQARASGKKRGGKPPELRELATDCELWQRRVTMSPADQRDAFVLLRALEGDDRPLVEGMLRGWARRLHLEVVELEPSLLWVSGVGAFGSLRREAGLHRLTRGARAERQSSMVRVEVVPAAAPLPEAEVRLELRAAGRKRVWARALHLPSLRVAEASSALPESEHRQLVLEMLAGRVEDREEDGELVRLYRLEPEREVRDRRSGLRTGKLDAILAGELSLFDSE